MTSPVKRFYPKLSEIINVDEIPEALGFIKDAIEQKLESIYYKDLQVFKGQNGASSSYSITLINNKKLSFTIPGSNGIELVLNPTDDPTDVSTIPLKLGYTWPILSYIRQFINQTDIKRMI